MKKFVILFGAFFCLTTQASADLKITNNCTNSQTVTANTAGTCIGGVTTKTVTIDPKKSETISTDSDCNYSIGLLSDVELLYNCPTVKGDETVTLKEIRGAVNNQVCACYSEKTKR